MGIDKCLYRTDKKRKKPPKSVIDLVSLKLFTCKCRQMESFMCKQITEYTSLLSILQKGTKTNAFFRQLR